MKINETGRIASVNAYNKDYGGNDVKLLKKGKQSTKDNIQISQEAKELLEAQRSREGSRSDRLEELRSSIQNGTYHVEAMQIAEKLYRYLK